MTTSIKRDEIFDKDRRPLVVSTVLMSNGRYETAVLRKDGMDLEMSHCNTEECALRIHGKWVKKYAYNPDKPAESPLLHGMSNYPRTLEKRRRRPVR